MTQEEILQYNKRCADFMGLKISIKLEDGYSCGTWYKPTDNENEYLPCPVMYHSDWNWIMEVVEAIEKLGHTVDIWNNVCVIPHLKKCISESKKEAVVQAIDSFLKFYNKNLEMSK